jgi:hypothetical protein
MEKSPKSAVDVAKPTDAVSPTPVSPSKAVSKKKKAKQAVDPAELARLEAERVHAAKVLEAKQAIEDIPHQQMIKSRLMDGQ